MNGPLARQLERLRLMDITSKVVYCFMFCHKQRLGDEEELKW